ncbi:Chk1 protein kinase, partial [Pestalotiopsis sp. IQ-011]
WANCVRPFPPGIPNFGNPIPPADSFNYQEFCNISYLGRNPEVPAGAFRSVKGAKKTLYQVINWCVSLIQHAFLGGPPQPGDPPNPYVPGAPFANNSMLDASGFPGIASLYVATFMLLHANSPHGQNPARAEGFINDNNFQDELAIFMAYGASAAENNLFRREIRDVATSYGPAYWPPQTAVGAARNAAAGGRTWLHVLQGVW